MGIIFRPGSGGPPGLPPPKAVPAHGDPCGFVGTSGDGETWEGSPGQGPTPIHDGARPLFLGGVFFNGWQGVVGVFSILSVYGATGVKAEPAGS